MASEVGSETAPIPTLTVTSLADDDFQKERDVWTEELKESEFEIANEQHEYKTPRPTHLPVLSIDEELREAVLHSTAMSDELIDNASRNNSVVVESLTVATPETISIVRPMSADCLSTRGLLTPGSEYDSDFGSVALHLSDVDVDVREVKGNLHPMILKERADSDPSEIIKKTKKFKNLKSSFKAIQKKNDSDSQSKSGAVGELARASMVIGVGDSAKFGKIKRKSKDKTRRKIAKMTKKLSDKQVLSPSYKQKNEDFHKFFKDLPSTERLLVDYACALVKDILVQGRVYASQNYLCFHSNILKWQTAVTVKLVDIDQMTKEKTVKVIPNAIQILLKDKTKITFTSFTARDRAYLTIFRLWQNALLDKPMSANELWSQIHRNYGEELGGCSSDDDYVRPKLMPKKHQTLTGHDGDLKYEFGTTNKVKRSSSSGTQTLLNGELDKSERSSKSSQDSPMGERQAIEFSDEKSSNDEISLGDDITNMEDEGVMKPETSAKNPVGDEKNNVLPKEPEESDDEPEEYLMQELPKSSFCRIYNISVRDLYRIIFSDDCPFWKETLVNKGTTGITFGTWQNEENSDGQYVRELSYTLRLDNSIGPKTSFVKETQLYYTSSVEGKSYIIDCVAQNYGIPYADYFYTVMRYGIRKVSKTSCELRISWELRYKKSPWGLVKNFIEKNVASGMAENFKKLQHQIQERIDFEKTQPQTSIKKSPEKSSGMRRRKRKSVSQAASTAQTKAKTSESSQKGAGDVHNSSDMNNNKSGSSSSSDVTPGVPPIYPANGFIPNQPHSYNAESPKLHYFGHGSKFIFSAIVFLFVLLLYSNYTMYHRLLVLEQATAAAATAEGVDPSVTAALLDRPGVPITSNPEVLSIYLQAIDKRLRRLEDTVLKFTQDSNRKWEKFEKSFEAMESLLDKAVEKKALKVP